MGSPLLSKLTAVPDKKQIKIIAEVAESVIMQAAKSSDKLQLRLRFSKPVPAVSAPAASAKKEASAKAPAPAVSKSAASVKNCPPLRLNIDDRLTLTLRLSAVMIAAQMLKIDKPVDKPAERHHQNHDYY